MYSFSSGLCTLACVIFLSFSHQTFAEEHSINVVTNDETGEVSFEPNRLVIRPGDTVTWINRADNLHNMMTYPDGYPTGAKGFSSPFLMAEGDTWSFTFTHKGLYQYHCIPHIYMAMEGEIIVGTDITNIRAHQPNNYDIEAYLENLSEFYDRDEITFLPERIQKAITKK